MHFEILVEDQSGKVALEAFVPKIIPEGSTFKIIAYKGIGHIPRNLISTLDPKKRVLLNQLPRLLAGYGKTFLKYPEGYNASVVIICDLDNRNKDRFLAELNAIFENCDPRPNGCVCLSVKEGEAWLLGHKDAVETAYPNAKKPALDAYFYDSICATWETLANAVYPGGATSLLAKGKPEVGRLKSVWAANIAPLIDIDANQSPSFQFFVKRLRELSKNE